MTVVGVIEEVDAVFVEECKSVGRPEPGGPRRAVDKNEGLCLRGTKTGPSGGFVRRIGEALAKTYRGRGDLCE